MRRGNHPWLVAGALVLGFVGLLSGLYGAIGRDLVWQWWDDPDYSHGFLVPLLSGFLAWKRRKQLAALKPNGTWIGAAVLVIALAELLLGDLAGENFLMRSSIVLVLAGLVLFHRGWPTFRLLAFPLLFLLFMVPLPATVFYAVAFPLQRLAAQNAAWVLDLMGVPVLLDGNVIHLSQISLGVTEACSGIRSLISLLAVAVAWGALTLPRLWAIGVLVAATVPITIVANAGRVVATGLIAQWVGTDYAQGFFHVVSGWVIFLLAFVCLLAVHGVLGLIQARRDKQGR
jgi:exosortase